MGAFDRFRKLEGPRPERKGPAPTTEGVAERFGQPEMPADASDSLPINCAKCGADNKPKSERCYNCGADLDTLEMRAHQEKHRAQELELEKRRAERREAQKREAEATLQREVERQKKDQELIDSVPSDSPSGLASQMPIAWLWRATTRVPDGWLRLSLQLAIVGGIGALVMYGISSPTRYGLLAVVAILLGGGGGGYYYRRRRWWW
jgi:hypothetical protein